MKKRSQAMVAVRLQVDICGHLTVVDRCSIVPMQRRGEEKRR